MEHRFWKDFGKVLEGFWEAKILDFRIFVRCFFDAFFQQIFRRPKNRKKEPNKTAGDSFWVGLAECASSGGEKKRGGEGLRCRRYRKHAGYKRSQARSMTRSMMVCSARPAHLTVGGGALCAMRRANQEKISV